MCKKSEIFYHDRKSQGDLSAYEDWVKNSVCVTLSYHKFLGQKQDIERKLRILEAMASDLIEEGIDNFQKQNNFPNGRSHFSQFVHALAKIAGIKREI